MGKHWLEGFSDGVIAIKVRELQVWQPVGYHPSIAGASPLLRPVTI